MMSNTTFLLVLAGFCVCIVAQLNERPIIGVFAQPSDSNLQKFGEQFIAASYVKFVEGAGARVAPIRYTLTPTEIENVFNSINGFLLPGGGVDFGTQHQYWTTLNTFYTLAMKANAAGDYFPIWGTCMGFQELCIVQSQNLSLLSAYNTENYTIPLNFTDLSAKSRMFGNAPENIVNILATEPVTMNNHNYGVSPASFASQPQLNTFFNVLSTNVDRNGKEFLSTIEGKSFPIYGTQWHPEKPLYEWNIHEVINHSSDSILVNSYAADFFVSESRKSLHKFATIEEEMQALIYNYEPIYIYNYVNDFEQGYFLNSTML